jgi:hypothetical protein
MPNLRTIQRILVAVLGGTVLLVGVALIVLPGPAFVVIPAGLALLAMEFTWARRWLRRARTLVASRIPSDGVPPAGKPLSACPPPLAALSRWWRLRRRLRLQSSRHRP